MKRIRSIVFMLLLFSVLLTSCGNNVDLLNDAYFDADYKAKNDAFFPKDKSSSRKWIPATDVDAGMPSTMHYVIINEPNCGVANYFEPHWNIWEYCLSPAKVIPNGGIYHGVSYRCICGYSKMYFLKCVYQDLNCDGKCINYGKDWKPGEEN